MSTTATTISPCPSPTLRSTISNTHPIALRSPSTFTFPSELRSPICSSFPLSHAACSTTAVANITTNTSLSSMSTPAITTMIAPLKTPITPPTAYTAFLQCAVTHASASNTPIRAAFADTEAAFPKSPRYFPGSASLPNEEGPTSSTPAKVPLSPMYAEFLKQHFGHSMHHRPVVRRFRASVSGPAGMQRGTGSGISSGLSSNGNGRISTGEPRSPGLVTLGNAGIINGSLRNKKAIINVHRVRAAAAAAAAIVERDKDKSNQKDKSAQEKKVELEEPGSSTSTVSPSTPSCSSASNLLSDSSSLKSGSIAVITLSTSSSNAKIRKIEPEASPAATPNENCIPKEGQLQVPKSERKRPSEGGTAQVSDLKGVSVDDNIKESTVEFSEGAMVPTAMNLMPAPKGKRRKIE